MEGIVNDGLRFDRLRGLLYERRNGCGWCVGSIEERELMTRQNWLSAALLVGVLIACGDNGMGPDGSGQGHITYALPNGNVYRIAARAGATPQNVSAALDALSPGTAADEWINTSADGQWLLLSTERFDPACTGWACLTIVNSALSVAEVVRVGGNVVHPTGYSAVASGGDVVVFEDVGASAHTRDLWVTTGSAGAWSPPVALTTSSPYLFNSQPSFSADGSKIVFDCGNEPYGAEGTAICEVGVNGTGFRIVIRPQDSPGTLPKTGALHHPAYTADGSIVFEADWIGEQVWRLAPGAIVPVVLASQVTNDNSPCVLPDGRIASLWLNRAGNAQGLHELKIMTANGSAFLMALTLTDVADIGIGCGL